jgi:hypothetical protein
MTGNQEQTSSMDSQQLCDPTNAVFVWVKMGEIFGSAWKASFGAAPNSMWVEQLSKLTDVDIRRGFNKMFRDDSDYPPNLKKFLDFCKPDVVEDFKKQEREGYQWIARNRLPKTQNDAVRKRERAIQDKYPVGLSKDEIYRLFDEKRFFTEEAL